jgi:methionyl-tRNA formyltransferase
LKVFESEKHFEPHNLQSGTIKTDGKNYLDIAVKDGFIRLLSIQQAGKKRMSTSDFLRGNGHLFV